MGKSYLDPITKIKIFCDNLLLLCVLFHVATRYAKDGNTAREDDGDTVRENNGNTTREANDDITRRNDGDAARENDGSSSPVHGCPNEAKHDVSTRAAHGTAITYILTFIHNTTIDTTKLSDKLIDYITTNYMIRVKKTPLHTLILLTE